MKFGSVSQPYGYETLLLKNIFVNMDIFKWGI